MIFNGKTIKSVANKFLGKFQKPKDETVEVNADAWKSMYPLFCNQELSAPGVAIGSLQTLSALVDNGIVGDYKDLQKVLLHKNDEVAHFALDVLRKIKGLAIETRIEGEKPARPESREENIGKMAQKKNQQVKEPAQFMPDEKEPGVFNALKMEDFIDKKLRDIEKKVEELGMKVSEMPANFTQDYDNKTRVLEDGIVELKKLVESKNILTEKAVDEKLMDIEKRVGELSLKIPEIPENLIQDYDNKTRILEENIIELKKLVESKNVQTEKAVAEELADIEKKVEDLGMKVSEMPANLTQDYDNKARVLEDNIIELKKLVESKNVLAEKVTGQVLNHIKPTEQISGSGIPSFSQFMQKTSEKPQYSKDQRERLYFLDNTPETLIILLNWVKFLMENVGRTNLEDILEYYVKIGWISEEVSSIMASYAEGLDYYIEKPRSDVLPEVHTKSLLFIEMIRKKNKKLFNPLRNLAPRQVAASIIYR